MQQQQTRTAEALTAKGDTIHELENQVRSLGKELRRKDAEINAERKTWAPLQKMVSAMQTHQVPELDSQQDGVCEDGVTKEVNFDDEQASQLEEDFNISFDTSSSRQEPTPKRQKPRHSFKVPVSRPQQVKARPPSSPATARRMNREPLRETAPNRSSRQSLPAGHHKLDVVSPQKSTARHRTRKSIAAPLASGVGSRPLGPPRAEKENAYVSRDELPFSTMRTEDLDTTTDSF